MVQKLIYNPHFTELDVEVYQLWLSLFHSSVLIINNLTEKRFVSIRIFFFAVIITTYVNASSSAGGCPSGSCSGAQASPITCVFVSRRRRRRRQVQEVLW